MNRTLGHSGGIFDSSTKEAVKKRFSFEHSGLNFDVPF